MSDLGAEVESSWEACTVAGRRPWRGGGRGRGGRWQTWLAGVGVGGGDAGTVRTGVRHTFKMNQRAPPEGK